MARIIQRCFLIIAFTGILLSSAQKTISEVSDSSFQSNETLPSAPEDNFNSLETTSSFLDEAEASTGITDKAVTDTSSYPETTTDNLNKKYNKTFDSSSSETSREDNSENISSEPKGSDIEHASSTEIPPSNFSHSGGLFKAELQDSVVKATEVPLKENDFSAKQEETKTDVVLKDVYDNPQLVLTKQKMYTPEAALLQSNHAFSSHIPYDSGQSSVPLKGELIFNSSNVDRNQITDEIISTTQSGVEFEESEANDAKASTRKRSLNATNMSTRSTTVFRTEETSSPDLVALIDVRNRNVGIPVLSGEKAPIVSGHTSVGKYEKETDTIAHDAEPETTNFSHKINENSPDTDVSAVHFTESRYVEPELSSTSYIKHTRMSPISLAALSTLNEESIHPAESTGSSAQISTEKLGIYSSSSISERSSELEVEYEDFATVPHPSFSPVTFDPDGMTHNFSQDPDSITFTPITVHVHGIANDKYLSHLEQGEPNTQMPEFLPDHLDATYATEELRNTEAHEIEEREREELSSPSHGLLPHDEPNSKELPLVRVVPPLLEHQRTREIVTPETILPLNDESEEMLNDSPHFVKMQSKPTTTPTAAIKNKHVTKELEMNISNDIPHATKSSHQNTPKTNHELDFPVDFQTQQSEIRPVTAVIPSNTSETTTILPISRAVELNSPSDVIPRQPDVNLNDTSSPVSPAPSEIIQPPRIIFEDLLADKLPKNYTYDLEPENDTAVNVNSTIAGVAVKTSVSVSLPLSKISSENFSPSVTPETDDQNISSNTSQVGFSVPIGRSIDSDLNSPPPVPPAEAPTPSTTESRGLRIRKPKLRINGDSDDQPATTRTRKPFGQPPQRPSTTTGPPVSIFNKARTRVASITSSTTPRPFPQFSTIRIHYASRMPGMVPGGELVFSTEPVTTTVPTTTETEEPFSYELFTEQTQGPIVPNEDDVTLIKVAGVIVIDKGLRWRDQLNNRYSPQYKERSKFLQMQLYRLFRTSPIASQLWKIEIDGFSGKRNSRSVVIDFIMYLIKTPNDITSEQLMTVFHDKLKNNTFSRFTVDTNKTAFEFLDEEPMKSTTEPPEQEQDEPVIPQWAIAVIVVGAASLIFIVLFAAVAILGRHHVRRRYSSKLNDEDSDSRPTEWESKMAAAYENLAADTIYDAEDLHSDTYKKAYLVD